MLKAYETVRKEFEEFDKTLLTKKEIILLTKKDLADEKIRQENKELFEKKGLSVLEVSVYDDNSIKDLKEKIISSL